MPQQCLWGRSKVLHQEHWESNGQVGSGRIAVEVEWAAPSGLQAKLGPGVDAAPGPGGGGPKGDGYGHRSGPSGKQDWQIAALERNGRDRALRRGTLEWEGLLGWEMLERIDRQAKASVAVMKRAGRVAVRERAIITLMMEAAAARMGLPALQEHGLWEREHLPKSAVVLTQDGWGTGGQEHRCQQLHEAPYRNQIQKPILTRYPFELQYMTPLQKRTLMTITHWKTGGAQTQAKVVWDCCC